MRPIVALSRQRKTSQAGWFDVQSTRTHRRNDDRTPRRCWRPRGNKLFLTLTLLPGIAIGFAAGRLLRPRVTGEAFRKAVLWIALTSVGTTPRLALGFNGLNPASTLRAPLC